jgi:hypothetical protein
MSPFNIGSEGDQATLTDWEVAKGQPPWCGATPLLAKYFQGECWHWGSKL